MSYLSNFKNHPKNEPPRGGPRGAAANGERSEPLDYIRALGTSEDTQTLIHEVY